MFNRKRKRLEAMALVLIASMNLSGCSFKSEKRENKEMLTYLENKYDKKFESNKHLERVGDGPFKPKDFKKGTAYCTDNKNEQFNILLYDSGLCMDNYQNITMMPYVKEYYKSITEKYWSSLKIAVELNGGNTNNKFSESEPLKYLAGAGVGTDLWIYIPQENEININTESEKIRVFLSQFLNLGLGGEVIIAYVNEETMIDVEEYDSRPLWKSLKDEGRVITYFSDIINNIITNQENLITTEEIKSKLDKNKN